MGTARLESFSDGVIAVAITLLVLGLTVPDPAQGHLLSRLGHHWPQYVAYVISFMTIGVIWINHHVMIGRLRMTDHAILILNLVLLMSIGILPFATGLMADSLQAGRGERVAAAIYAGAFLVMALAFAALNRLILLGRPEMHVREMPLDQRRAILARSLSGLLPYAAATALAFVSPVVTLAICGALAAFYASPLASRDGSA